MSNKITYGLSNAHVWPILSTNANGVPTYGTIINMPGSVELSLDAEGSSDPFYADDVIYYQGVANNGYSGSLTLADVPASFLTVVMKEAVDSQGAYIENADANPLEFAIAFEFKGDAAKRRHVFYRCKATRPSIASQTKEDSVSPNTLELQFVAMPRLDNSNVKARCEETDVAYASWYGEAPYAAGSDSTGFYYVAVDDTTGMNPAEQGWFEKVDTTTYARTTDTTPDAEKTYYIRTIKA